MKEETLRKLMLACACMLAATALAGCGSDDSSSASSTDSTTEETTTTAETETTTTEAATPTVVSIVIVDGVPKDGIVRESVDKGDRVVLVVKSDVADEIHVHGYDIMRDVTAGGTARLPFTATLPGVFEVELEDHGVQIAELTVNP
jgi:ABC-type glycerol-3-phosphate transport system substrate-binding protein